MTSEGSEPPRGSESRTGSDATREPRPDDADAGPLDVTGCEGVLVDD